MVISQAVFLIMLAEYCLSSDDNTMGMKHLSVSLQERTVNDNNSHVERAEISKCETDALPFRGFHRGITAVIF